MEGKQAWMVDPDTCKGSCVYHGVTEYLVDYSSHGTTAMCAKCIEEFADQIVGTDEQNYKEKL